MHGIHRNYCCTYATPIRTQHKHAHTPRLYCTPTNTNRHPNTNYAVECAMHTNHPSVYHQLMCGCVFVCGERLRWRLHTRACRRVISVVLWKTFPITWTCMWNKCVCVCVCSHSCRSLVRCTCPECGTYA